MILKLAILGVVVGANNLAVSLALGALGQSHRRARIVTVFGLFEFFIPLVGVALGQALSGSIGTYAQWVATGLLLLLGLFTILSGMRYRSDDTKLARAATNWKGLILLSAGLSADNLIVGFTLGLNKMTPLAVATTIAVCSIVFSWTGLTVGNEMRRSWEKRAKISAGCLLILLALSNFI